MQKSQLLLDVFKEFLNEAKNQIETNQVMDPSALSSQRIADCMQYLRDALKFLASYIRSDV